MPANPASDIQQQCLQQCQQTAQQLRSMATQGQNSQVKMMLNEGSHHLDLCIEECQYSLNQLQPSAIGIRLF